jgi:hypothetical protein
MPTPVEWQADRCCDTQPAGTGPGRSFSQDHPSWCRPGQRVLSDLPSLGLGSGKVTPCFLHKVADRLTRVDEGTATTPAIVFRLRFLVLTSADAQIRNPFGASSGSLVTVSLGTLWCEADLAQTYAPGAHTLCREK